MPKFANVSCSSCGKDFGPGDHGFSHCDSHGGVSMYDMIYDTPRIVTRHVYPPIPMRKFDWCAYRDGDVEAGNYGWGATEPDAVRDLLDKEAES